MSENTRKKIKPKNGHPISRNSRQAIAAAEIDRAWAGSVKGDNAHDPKCQAQQQRVFVVDKPGTAALTTTITGNRAVTCAVRLANM